MNHSFVFQYLMYCIEIWGNASAIHLEPLIKILKKCIRAITFSEFSAPSKLTTIITAIVLVTHNLFELLLEKRSNLSNIHLHWIVGLELYIYYLVKLQPMCLMYV